MNKLDGLSLKFRGRVEAALDYMARDKELHDLGAKFVLVVEGPRELSRQMAYFSRGRMTTENVNAMYAAAHLDRLTDTEAQTPITWTLKSKHLDNLAADLCPSQDGKTYWWKAPPAVWARMCLIGNSFGLECGLNWPDKKKDPGHYEQKEA